MSPALPQPSLGMLRLLLYALCSFELIRTCFAYDAPCKSTVYTKCSCEHRVVIAIDAPISVHVQRGLEFNITKSIIQQLDIRENFISVGMFTYGESSFNIYYASYNRKQICDDLENVWQHWEGPHSAIHVPLSSIIESLFYNFNLNDATLVLLTKSSDQYDVDAASKQLQYHLNRSVVRNFSAVVINLGQSSFDKWPQNTVVYRVNSLDADHIADIVCNSVCGHGSHFDYTSTPSPPTATSSAFDYSSDMTTFDYTSTPPPPTATSTAFDFSSDITTTYDLPTYETTTESTTASSTPTRTSSATPRQLSTQSTELYTVTTTVDSTSESTPTTPPEASINNTGCNCVLKTVWLDVFLLMDASMSMTPNGIDSASDYVVSAFTKLTVGQAERYQTRFGVIRYADTVELIADLNVYTSTADLFQLEIPLLKESGTNIEGAIRMAMSKFLSPSHRAAARPVLIIVGSAYKDGGYNDPTQIAHEFRADGGTIITIEYVQEHGLSVPMLQKLASPNFSLTNRKIDGTELRANELRQLLCEANCFCKKNWMPYITNRWNAPHGGCYYPIAIPSIQILARRTCYRKNDAVLVLDEDSKKDAFLTNAFPPKTKFWLGLRYQNNQWTWPGGYSAGFTKWAPGHPKYQAGRCAYMQVFSGSKSAWFTDDCDNDHNYICQAKPCDSTNYCEVE